MTVQFHAMLAAPAQHEKPQFFAICGVYGFERRVTVDDSSSSGGLDGCTRDECLAILEQDHPRRVARAHGARDRVDGGFGDVPERGR